VVAKQREEQYRPGERGWVDRLWVVLLRHGAAAVGRVRECWKVDLGKRRQERHGAELLGGVDERIQRIERLFDVPVLVAALLVIPAIVLEESSAGRGWKQAGGVLNWLIWIIFASELIVMLAVVPSRKRWLRHHPLEVVIVVLTPPFLPASLQAARVLRLLRLLRLVRLAEMGRRVFSLQGLQYAALLTLMVVLSGGAAFAALEKGRSSWDGLFWAVSTVTTGDSGAVTPQTTGGRLVAIVVMLVGTGFLAILTAAMAERFLSREIREEVQEAETEFAQDLASAEADVLQELRTITARLQELERAVERRLSDA